MIHEVKGPFGNEPDGYWFQLRFMGDEMVWGISFHVRTRFDGEWEWEWILFLLLIVLDT